MLVLGFSPKARGEKAFEDTTSNNTSDSKTKLFIETNIKQGDRWCGTKIDSDVFSYTPNRFFARKTSLQRVTAKSYKRAYSHDRLLRSFTMLLVQACLPFGVDGGGFLATSKEMLRVAVSVQHLSCTDPLGLGITQEQQTSLTVRMQIGYDEENLTFSWLATETAMQFRLDTGVSIALKRIYGLYWHEAQALMPLQEDLVETLRDMPLPEGERYYRFTLVTSGPINDLNDRTLLYIGDFITDANPRDLLTLCKTSPRFRRVFSSDKAWRGAGEHLERAYGRVTGGISSGISSVGIHAWLISESGLPLFHAMRVRWVSLTSCRLGIYLGSIPEVTTSSFTNRALHFLAANFSAPDEYLARLAASSVEPRHEQRNLLMVSGPKAQLILDSLQYCLPATAHQRSIRIKAALPGYSVVDRSEPTPRSKVATRLELPDAVARAYWTAADKAEKERIVQRADWLRVIGDDRLCIARCASRANTAASGPALRLATHPRTLAHVLALPCRLCVPAVLDKLPRSVTDINVLIPLIREGFAALPETREQEKRLEAEICAMWAEHMGPLQPMGPRPRQLHTAAAAAAAAAGGGGGRRNPPAYFYGGGGSSGLQESMDMIHDAVLLADGGTSSSGGGGGSSCRPLLILLALEGLGRPGPDAAAAAAAAGGGGGGGGVGITRSVWSEDAPRGLIRGVGQYTTPVLDATARLSLSLSTGGGGGGTTTHSPASTIDEEQELQKVFSLDAIRYETATQLQRVVKEEEEAVHEYQESLVKRTLVILWQQRVEEMLDRARQQASLHSHHTAAAPAASSGFSSSISSISSSYSIRRMHDDPDRPWHIQAVNAAELDKMSYSLGPALNARQRKRLLAGSGFTAGVNALIRMITANNSVSGR
jgi:hypothetical protein